LKAVEKWGLVGKGVRESNGGVEVTYTHSGHTLKHPFEYQFKY
jgi:hypothetical protein